MTVDVDGPVVRYRSRRRWPHAPATLDATIRVGAVISPAEMSDRDVFLTARFCLYTVQGGSLRRVWAAHEPWPLHRAQPVQLHQDLLQAARLPHPARPALARFSPGVTVRVGRLDPIAPIRTGT